MEISRIKNILLYSIAIVVFGSNIVNYFYCYLLLDDWELQWRVAMLSISLAMLLMSAYIWVSSKYKLISGWLFIYLFFNFIGVLIGYDLHTKGFMAILFITTFFGLCHIIYSSWRK